MPKMDDILQLRLESLESGVPLTHVLSGLPEELTELSPLIQLASVIRERPLPEPNLSDTLVEDVLASMKQTDSLLNRLRGAFRAITSPPAYRLAGVAITAMLIVVSILSFGLWFGRSRDVRNVTLIEVAGLVEVSSGESANDWQVVSSGHQIAKGQRIRTGPDGAVTFVFYEGSRATLGPDTDLVLLKVAGDGQRELVVEMDQRTGETSHSVVPLQGGESFYQVHTPAGSASVRGTSFSVVVESDSTSRFAVYTGAVVVTADSQEIVLLPGQVTTVMAGEALEAPEYQFTLKGILTDKNGDDWTVDGVTFTVTAKTNIKDDPQVDSFVLVDGHIETDGTWVADMVKAMKDKKAKSSFTGIVESQGDTWVISGKSVLVIDGITDIKGDPQVEDPVEVTFIVQEDLQWLALEIELLEDKPVERTPTPTESGPTPTPTNTPTATLTVTLKTDCTGANPQPKADELARTYGVTYEEIMGWFCQGYGFGEIDLAYGLSLETGVPVADIFAMRASGMGWGEIKALLQPTKTPKPTKEKKPTKTPKPSKTPKDVPEPKTTKEDKPTKEAKPTKSK